MERASRYFFGDRCHAIFRTSREGPRRQLFAHAGKNGVVWTLRPQLGLTLGLVASIVNQARRAWVEMMSAQPGRRYSGHRNAGFRFGVGAVAGHHRLSILISQWTVMPWKSSCRRAQYLPLRECGP